MLFFAKLPAEQLDKVVIDPQNCLHFDRKHPDELKSFQTNCAFLSFSERKRSCRGAFG